MAEMSPGAWYWLVRNADYTLVINVKTALHLIPSGIMRPGRLYISNGVVLTGKPFEEIEGLEKAGVEVQLTPAHQRNLPVDPALPLRPSAFAGGLSRKGGIEIGTTGR
jgi:adenylosuccinate synthase